MALDKFMAYTEELNKKGYYKWNCDNIVCSRPEYIPLRSYKSENGELGYPTIFHTMIYNQSGGVGRTWTGETTPNGNGNAYWLDGDCFGGPNDYWQWGGTMDTNGNGVYFSMTSFSERPKAKVVKEFRVDP